MPTVDLKDIPGLLTRLNRDNEKAILDAAYATAIRLVGVIQNEIIPAEKPQPVFDGAYRAAWEPARAKDGATVSNTLPYAAVIENGARGEKIKPGRAMIKALTEWVRRKGLVSRKGIGPTGKVIRLSKAQVEPAAEKIAWAIVQAMKKRGIFNRDGGQGLKIAEKAAKLAPELFREELLRALKGDGGGSGHKGAH